MKRHFTYVMRDLCQNDKMTCALLAKRILPYMRHITAAEVYFVEMLCLTVSENHVAIINCHCSHVTITYHRGSWWYVLCLNSMHYD